MVWREKESFPVHLAYQLRDEVHAKIIHFKLTSSRFWSVTTIEREITFGMMDKGFKFFFFDFLSSSDFPVSLCLFIMRLHICRGGDGTIGTGYTGLHGGYSYDVRCLHFFIKKNERKKVYIQCSAALTAKCHCVCAQLFDYAAFHFCSFGQRSQHSMYDVSTPIDPANISPVPSYTLEMCRP